MFIILISFHFIASGCEKVLECGYSSRLCSTAAAGGGGGGGGVCAFDLCMYLLPFLRANRSLCVCVYRENPSSAKRSIEHPLQQDD